MKKCHYCDFENKDTAHFCVKCGKDLEKHCPKCNGALSMEEEEIYCPSCGARVDGKLECPKCGAVNEGGNKFCEGCGAPLTCASPSTLRANPYANPSAAGVSAPQSAPVKAPKEKKDTRRLLVRILDICRASLILVFSLVFIMLS
ncbi:MAG: double zinc ribbon domain-containing protein [Christensenellaceae bacterium]